MARIRSAKPDWWTDAKMCALRRDVRFTYKGLIEVMADDEGRFLADPRLVKGQVWPLDDDITVAKVKQYLAELAAAKRIVLYEAEGGKYGVIPTFLAHQKISHPTPSKLPEPPREIPEPLAKDSGTAPEVLRPDVDLDVDVDLDGEEEAPSASSNGAIPAPDPNSVVVPPSRKMRGGWPARVSDAFARKGVKIEPGHAGAVLGLAVKQYKSERIVAAVEYFLEDGVRVHGEKPGFITLDGFARNPAFWVEQISPAGTRP